MKKTKWIVGLSIVSLVALSGTAFALNSGSVAAKSVGQTLGYIPTATTTQIQETTPQPSIITFSTTNNNPDSIATPELDGYSGGYGMMGGQGGYGMMGGQGGYGMMGGQGGYGMMGGGYDAKSLGIDLTNGLVASADQAVAIAKAYAQKINQDLSISQLHEFSNAYGVEFKEGKTGAKAYEVMVFMNGGRVITDMGPNIMWNTKYGHMNWGNDGAVTVSEEQATKNAQEFVTKMGQGYSIGKPELAPGYYEFMVQKDGKDYTELDVNGYTGQVWLQNWQGPIIQSIDFK